MGDSITGQVSTAAAEVYDACYLPAIFAEWAPRVAAAAAIEPGQRVLDVACGTGVLTQEASSRSGDSGRVIGIDNNAGMLAVARRKAPATEWIEAPAESLPFPDASFDSVVCQFGLMYFEDHARALGEMWRVLRENGRLAFVVWDRLDRCPGFAAEERVWMEAFDNDEVDAAPWSLGDPRALRLLLTQAGIDDADIETRQGTARFASIEDWIRAGVRGWTEDEAIDETGLAQLLAIAEARLAGFAGDAGAIAFTTSAHLVSARKPRA